MQDPLETSELLAFARIVDAKSLSRAAAELGVPRATVGRRLARLEERLGARLLHRTTRRQSLTEAGEVFYRHARIVLDAVGNAEASVRRVDDAVRGDLRISVPPIPTHGFYATLCDFATRYPEVRLHVHFSTRHVDLQRDGYDIALRAGEIETGLIARTLARMVLIAVASPVYLEKHGSPRHVRDLKGHRCLLGFARGELPQTHWPLKKGGKLQIEGNLVSNEITLLAEAAVQGLGIALLPTFLVVPLIERGELVHVLPGVIEAPASVAVVYLDREYVPPHLRAFVEALSLWARRELATGVTALQQMTNVRPPASQASQKSAKAPSKSGKRAPSNQRSKRP
jgi:DNA-binding transcriptional LysR family regulator